LRAEIEQLKLAYASESQRSAAAEALAAERQAEAAKQAVQQEELQFAEAETLQKLEAVLAAQKLEKTTMRKEMQRLSSELDAAQASVRHCAELQSEVERLRNASAGQVAVTELERFAQAMEAQLAANAVASSKQIQQVEIKLARALAEKKTLREELQSGSGATEGSQSCQSPTNSNMTKTPRQEAMAMEREEQDVELDQAQQMKSAAKFPQLPGLSASRRDEVPEQLLTSLPSSVEISTASPDLQGLTEISEPCEGSTDSDAWLATAGEQLPTAPRRGLPWLGKSNARDEPGKVWLAS